MQIEALYPVDERLAKYVDYYYIFNSNRDQLDEFYIAYPHINTPVFFHDNVDVSFENNRLYYTERKKIKFETDIIGRSLKPFLCHAAGNIYAVTIVFKPLGLNHFITGDFQSNFNRLCQPLSLWNVHAKALKNILKEKDQTEIVNKMDTFLLSIMQPFNQPILTKAVLLLSDEEQAVAVGKLEKELHVDRKTLQRLFLKYTGFTPVNFKRIARFRNAMKLCKDTDKNLTEIAYQTQFADQSHFIKELKALTSDSPKRLLKETVYIDDSPFLMKLKVHK